MNLFDKIDFIIEHTKMDMKDVRTIAYQTDEDTLDQIIWHIQHGWEPSIAEHDTSDKVLDGLDIIFTKNGESKIM